MHTALRVALALGVAVGAVGCSDYLSGPNVTNDPNNVSKLVRPGPIYIAVQQNQAVQHEGQIARNAAEYTQQIAGFSRQQIRFDRYGISPGDIDPYFTAVYGSTINLTGGGGLLDIRKMQQLGRGLGDSLYIGIGKVYEALNMQLAADVWGDIPYREAADSNNRTPKFDPQLQVYADLLAQLDSAITVYLPATGPTNLGPPQDNSELIYRGRDAAGLAAVYTEVAHSLKARIYMHLAEVDPSNYARALAEVGPPGINNGGPGISTPDNDMLYFHDQSPQGNNIWVQFMIDRGDIAPGAAMIEIMKRRIASGLADTSRIAFYFTSADGGPASATNFFGVRPGGATGLQVAAGRYNGSGAPGTGAFSQFNLINNVLDFRQPELTWIESQLIGAEAALATGNAGLATAYLTAARANRTYGATGGAAVTFPPLGPAPATLQNIIEEKYVALFLNPEVWNDWKRTCLPSLAPAPAAGATTPGTSPIPGRLPYGLSETNANPNTPTTNSAGQPVSPTGRNPNDPNPCPVLNYTSSTPLAE
jgi:hypothetical protein